jgi:hypothetical protein
MTESYSIYYGNCFTVCDLQPVPVLKMVVFEIKRNLLLKGDVSLKKVSLILNMYTVEAAVITDIVITVDPTK